jgi:cation diffusion facilitator family transporter
MASGAKTAIYAALIGNLLVAVTKFVASGITGSSAMLSEGIHSLVDTGNQVLLLFGLHQAKKPPDKTYPFGHGKEIYFWSFIVAILIFAVGAGISIYEGIRHLIRPEPLERAFVNYIVLCLAMVFEGAALTLALKEFRKVKGPLGYIEAVRSGKNPSLFVVMFEDTAALLGLAVAFLGVLLYDLTGNAVYDGGASVIIGGILAATAAWLAYETKSLLIGEAAAPEVIAAIRELACEPEQVEYVNEVLTLHMGPDFLLVNLSVKFHDEMPASEMEDAIAALDAKIKRRFPMVKRVFVEAEARRRAETAVGLPRGVPRRED